MQEMKSHNYTKDGRIHESCQIGLFMIGTVRPLKSETRKSTNKCSELLSDIPLI
ncbi:hypothetical protein [Methanococcus maripaludis]|uniref:Uncharacterized protein n=1 Tax=Methanococcus maripaludis TaxID=39152 RepID=A0A8T4H558_METMI|nr:hypothetical protein [Methanococcus maripaludis]MBM7408747.1 hypothetical protein [Methanococcus maripaludis]MBP2219084.1 hypothetical protein [Methanococcus maripaludis]